MDACVLVLCKVPILAVPSVSGPLYKIAPLVLSVVSVYGRRRLPVSVTKMVLILDVLMMVRQELHVAVGLRCCV